MFNKAKNIDTAFRHIRIFCVAMIAACMVISCYAVFKSFSLVGRMQEKVYILANGKAIEAFAAERKDNIPVEARDHVKMFHHYFFTLGPDDKAIKASISKALYLADATAKKQYDNLVESNYYSNLISGNVSQTIKVDSIEVDIANYPFRFRLHAVQEITRPTSIAERSMVTEGALRNVPRSDNNPHGFLIEGWRIVENKDIRVKTRER